MNRADHLEDIERIRKALIKAGWDTVTLADCIAFAQLEWLDAINAAIGRIDPD